MAFLGGLALLGASGEAYQSARQKQQLLDEAAADQAASAALGAIGGDLAQLQRIGGVGGVAGVGGLPNAQAYPADQAAAPVRFAQDSETSARTPAPLTGGLVQGPQAAAPAPAAPAAAAPAQAAAFMAPGKGDLLTRPGEPSFGDRYPGAADLAAMAGLPAQGGGGQPAGAPVGGGRPVPTTPESAQPRAPLGSGAAQPPGQMPAPVSAGRGPQAGASAPNFAAGMMDLPTLAGLIKKNNPNITPEVFAKALQKGATLLAPFAQQQLREAMIQMQYKRLEAIHPGYEQFQEWLATNPNATAEEVGDAFNLFTGKKQLLTQRGAQTSEQIAQRGEEQRKTQAAKPQKTTAAVLKEREHQTAVKHLIDQIDTAVKGIDASLAGGASVTGLGGTVERWKEFGTGIGEQFGLTTGGGETPASNFETQIRIIQQLWPRVLSGSKITNKQEREHADQVIRGLGRFTSPQQAKNGLNEAKKVLQKFIEDEPEDASVKLPPGVKSIRVME